MSPPLRPRGRISGYTRPRTKAAVRDNSAPASRLPGHYAAPVRGGQLYADLRATQDVRRQEGGRLGAGQARGGAGRESRPAQHLRGWVTGGDAMAARSGGAAGKP